MNDSNEFLDIHLFINDEIINDVPLAYQLLTPCTVIPSFHIPTVESKYHRDLNYSYNEFYKPVSRLVFYNENK